MRSEGDVELGTATTTTRRVSNAPSYRLATPTKEETKDDSRKVADDADDGTPRPHHRLEEALYSEYSHAEFTSEKTWMSSHLFKQARTLKDLGTFHYPTKAAAEYFWSTKEVRRKRNVKWGDLSEERRRFFLEVQKGTKQLSELLTHAETGKTTKYRPPKNMSSFVSTTTTMFGKRRPSNGAAKSSKEEEEEDEEQRRRRHHPKSVDIYEMLPICSGSSTGRFCVGVGGRSAFESYGRGTAGWFKFLKWMGWTLVIMSLFHLPLMIFNSYNYEACALIEGNPEAPQNLYTQQEIDGLECYTAGIFETFLGHVAEVSKVEIDGQRVVAVLNISAYIADALDIETGENPWKSLAWYYVAFDVASAFALLASFVWLQVSLRQWWGGGSGDLELSRNIKSEDALASRAAALSAEDYSVELHGVPANAHESDIARFAQRVLGEANVIAVNPFCKKRQVSEIHSAVHIGSNRLNLFARRGKVMNEFVLAHLNVAKIQSQRGRGVGGHSVYALNRAVRNRNALLTKLRDLDLHAMNKIKNDRGEDDILYTVLTFNTIDMKNRFVEALRRRWLRDLLTCRKLPKYTDDRDLHTTKPREFDVWTRQPHHPSQIIWENLHYNYFACCKRRRRDLSDTGGWGEDLFTRRLFVLLVALVMILCTFVLAVALKQSADAGLSSCPSFAADLSIDDTSVCGACGARGESLFAADSSNADYRTCNATIMASSSYVAAEVSASEVDDFDCGFWRSAGVADVDAICESQYVMTCYCYANFWTACCFDFWGSYDEVLQMIAQYFGFSTAISIVLMLANFCMRRFLKRIVFLERPHSSAKKELSSAERILLFQLCNSGLILLFLPIDGENALDLSSFSLNAQWAEKLFTKEWYDQTGTLVLSTMLCYAISSWLFYLPYPYCLSRKRRGLLRPEATTSAIELNNEGLGEPFTLDERAADNMTIFILAVIFAPGFPILLPIAAAAMLATYWTDKWLFLRYYTIEIEYSLDILKHLATRYLPVAMVLHSVGALMMYGNYQIFLDMGTASSDVAACVEDASGRSWCAYDPRYNANNGKLVLFAPVIALAALVTAVWLLHELGIVFCSRVCRRRKDETLRYATFATNAPATDVVTYNMLANPRYQALLEMSDDVWKEEGKKHLHQVRNYIPLQGDEVRHVYKYTKDVREGCCCGGEGRVYTENWIAENEAKYFWWG